MVVKWEFLDPTDNSSAFFEVNPDAGGSPAYKKTLTTVATVAPGGKNVIYEGADVSPTLTFSGTILTPTMYNLLVLWFNKRHQIQLTDDLGRIMMIYITEFTPQRVYKATRFWFHTYTVTAQILDWP